MATIKYKKSDGTYATLTNYTVQPITPVQTTGTGTTEIMSQNAVTVELNKKADKATSLSGYGISDAYTKTETDNKLSGKADKTTTIAGYGITDAKISNGTITLGTNTITPLTAETITSTSAANTYLTKTDAGDTYLTKTSASNTYATTASTSAATGFTEFMTGCNTVTTVANIPITKRLVIVNITAGNTFTLSGTLASGREIHVIINNNGSSDITIPINSSYKKNVEEITIKSGEFGEINAISDGTNIYIRAI